MAQNIRAKTIKFLKQGKGINHDLGFSNGFLDVTPKAGAKEKNKLTFIRIKTSVLSKGIIKKVKRQPTDGRKYLHNTHCHNT